MNPHDHIQPDPFWDRPNKEILADFVALTSHDTGGTARGVAERIDAALKRYAASSGRYDIPLRIVITNVDILSTVMANDMSLLTGRQLSYQTMALVRHAFRAFAAAVTPPPGHTRADLRAIFDTARAGGEEYAGQRRRLTVGNRSHRPKHVPTDEEIKALVQDWWARGGSGPLYADLTVFLRLTGVRVNAALALRVRDLRPMPDGTTWVPVHEKSRKDRRLVLVPPSQSALVSAWRTREPDAYLWAHPDGRQVRRSAYYDKLAKACKRLGIPRFSPHGLRARLGRELTRDLGLDRAMSAIGWETSEAPERHYLSPQNPDDDGA